MTVDREVTQPAVDGSTSPTLRAALVELGMPADPEGQVGRVRNGFYDPVIQPAIQAHSEVELASVPVSIVLGEE